MASVTQGYAHLSRPNFYLSYPRTLPILFPFLSEYLPLPLLDGVCNNITINDLHSGKLPCIGEEIMAAELIIWLTHKRQHPSYL